MDKKVLDLTKYEKTSPYDQHGTLLDPSGYGLQEVYVNCADQHAAGELIDAIREGFQEYAAAHGLKTDGPDLSLTNNDDPDCTEFPITVAFRFVYSKYGVRSIRGFIPSIVSDLLSY